MTHFRRRMKRLLDILAGGIILGLFMVDCIVNPDPEDPT